MDWFYMKVLAYQIKNDEIKFHIHQRASTGYLITLMVLIFKEKVDQVTIFQERKTLKLD